MKKAGLRSSILNDWLLDVAWQFDPLEALQAWLASDVPSQLPLSELLRKDSGWD